MPNPVVNPTLIPSTVPIPFPSPRRDATEVPVGMGAVPKASQKTPFATRGCHWSTCGHGSRAEDLSEDPLRHAEMALMYLWAWEPCRRVGKIIGNRPVRDRLNDASPREDATGVPVGRGAVPKTGQKTPFATPGCH